MVYLLFCCLSSLSRKGGFQVLTDASILFQIAGIGIIVALIHTILKQMGKEEIAQFATLVGFIIVLVIVINGLSDLFQQLKSVFLFQG